MDTLQWNFKLLKSYTYDWVDGIYRLTDLEQTNSFEITNERELTFSTVWMEGIYYKNSKLLFVAVIPLIVFSKGLLTLYSYV